MGWSQPVPSPEMLVSAEHGHFQGHFHERTFGLMGLLEYARVQGDAWIMRFVQESYEYARCFGISRMGFFPAVLRPLAPRKDLLEAGLYLAADGSAPQCNEGCAVADMIWPAANLSKAGIGESWIQPTPIYHAASTGYTCMIEVRPGELLLCYDALGSGWSHDNSIMAVRITVDRLGEA